MKLSSFSTIFWPAGKPDKAIPSSKTCQFFRYYHANGKLNIFPEYASIWDIRLLAIRDLIDTLTITDILIVDQLSGVNGPVCIMDHVNRSGINFLRGQTPLDKRPMFPDMGSIYTVIDDLTPVSVHTLGPDYSRSEKSRDVIISRWAGIWSPVFSYFEVSTGAVNQEALQR